MTRQEEREAAIIRFKETHGNHTHEVIPQIDTSIMQELYEKYYKGRIDIAKYPLLNK